MSIIMLHAVQKSEVESLRSGGAGSFLQVGGRSSPGGGAMKTNALDGHDAPESGDEKNPNPPTLIFAGFARLPANAPFPCGGQILALEIEVDPYDMRIVDAACSCIPALGSKFLTELLVGKKFDDGFKEVMLAIRTRYRSITQRAMIAALEDALRRYEEFREEKNGGLTPRKD